jgi:hypothetical protein
MCNRNVRVTIRENEKQFDGFDIYLDIHGQLRYLMTHRHDGILWRILSKSPSVNDLPRIMSKEFGHEAKRKLKYLIRVIEDYMKYEMEETV